MAVAADIVLLAPVDSPISPGGASAPTSGGTFMWLQETIGKSKQEVFMTSAAITTPTAAEAFAQTEELIDLGGVRRKLMDAWATFCATAPRHDGNVTALRRKS